MLLSVDARALEAFHMKCQRQLLQLKWHQFVCNDVIAATTGLTSISETINRRRNALFGHVARLSDDVPAHKALNCQVNLSFSRPTTKQPMASPFAVPFVLVTDGLTRSGMTTTYHLQRLGAQ